MEQPQEDALRTLLMEDFEFYAANCLRIRTKEGNLVLDPDSGVLVPPTLVLNRAQRRIHTLVERQRGKTGGRVRVLIIKGRQQGGSTYCQARLFWRLTHLQGRRGFILAHKDDSTQNLFNMAKHYYDFCPAKVRPVRDKSNAKEMVFGALRSSYKVETAGGEGTGRSETIQFAHLSEVAYFPNAEKVVVGVTQAVPNAPDTEIIMESTSAGPQGIFYEMIQEALAGHSEYIVIFVPWYFSEEYALEPVPDGFTRTPDEEELAQRALEVDEVVITDAQLWWRRNKVVELRGIHNFYREYPSTIEEAFKADAVGALWKTPWISQNRVPNLPESDVPADERRFRMVKMVVGVDPSGGSKDKNDEQGIVVGGLGSDGHAYVLEDLSGKFTPEGWGNRAIQAYWRHGADALVVERNFGGDMVAAVIRLIDPKVNVVEVVATRGKAVRAEPVAALYERGEVHHVGHPSYFTKLETEMTTWNPVNPQFSPNRLDALVWVLTRLMLGTSNTVYAVSLGM